MSLSFSVCYIIVIERVIKKLPAQKDPSLQAKTFTFLRTKTCAHLFRKKAEISLHHSHTTWYLHDSMWCEWGLKVMALSVMFCNVLWMRSWGDDDVCRRRHVISSCPLCLLSRWKNKQRRSVVRHPGSIYRANFLKSSTATFHKHKRVTSYSTQYITGCLVQIRAFF